MSLGSVITRCHQPLTGGYELKANPHLLCGAAGPASRHSAGTQAESAAAHVRLVKHKLPAVLELFLAAVQLLNILAMQLEYKLQCCHVRWKTLSEAHPGLILSFLHECCRCLA